MIFSQPNLLQALADNDFTGQDEQSIREQWIYPLLTLLGYGLGTKNEVDIPYKVRLRPPVTRALGSQRWEIDYRPTVHGVGLWIIEAKRPSEDLFSDLHISQAWGYATHPRVDVPFMALANGQRLCVFDLTEETWDEPLIDMLQAELPTRFAELDSILGARRVAEFVRRRQLRHLRQALFAQLDEDILDQTLKDVAEIVEEARPVVRANHSTATLDAFEESRRERRRDLRTIGVWGLAYVANSPNVVIGEEVKLCADIVRERPPEERANAFGEMWSAAKVGDTIRPTFSLRVLRLSVALRLVGYEGCDSAAREIAEEATRDGSLGFPNDPIAAAAHRFEMVLAALVARVVLASGTDAAIAAADALKRQMNIETWIREEARFGLRADSMLSRFVNIGFRRLWIMQEPWTAAALDQSARDLRVALDKLPQRPNVEIGQIGNPNYEMHLEYDPLYPGTRNVLFDVARAEHGGYEQHSEESRMFARDLLQRYFNEQVTDDSR